jgi:protein-disulfide isomerase
MENAVLQSRLDAHNTYQIDSTPTFIINDKKYSGDRDIKELAAIIDPLLK